MQEVVRELHWSLEICSSLTSRGRDPIVGFSMALKLVFNIYIYPKYLIFKV
jgi:hypothetical protein